MAEQNTKPVPILKILLLAVAVLFLFRFAGPARFFILILLIAAAIGFAGYFAWNFLERLKQQRRKKASIEGLIQEKLVYCTTQIVKNEEEAEDIKESLRELRNELKVAEELNKNKASEVKRLIAGFESELKLRYAKIDFFKAAARKLKKIEQTKLLDESLSEKEEELKQLKEGHYDDLADMEALRSDVEMETLYLDTIESLSLKLNSTTSLESVKVLHKELEEMTRGLDE
jgi:hypothetical protein